MFGNFVEAEIVEKNMGKSSGDPKFVSTNRKISINLANVHSLEISGENITCVTRNDGRYYYVKGTPESLFEDSIRQMIERRGTFENKLREEVQAAAAQAPVIVTP